MMKLHKEVDITLNMNEDDATCIKACIEFAVPSFSRIGLDSSQTKKMVELLKGFGTIGIEVERVPAEVKPEESEKYIAEEYLPIQKTGTDEVFRFLGNGTSKLPPGYTVLLSGLDENGLLKQEFWEKPVFVSEEVIDNA